jgi:hypothetical protein
MRTLVRLFLLLLPLVLLALVLFFEAIVSSAGSDSCNGCDSTPGWVGPGSIVLGVGILCWLASAVWLAVRRVRRQAGRRR